MNACYYDLQGFPNSYWWRPKTGKGICVFVRNHILLDVNYQYFLLTHYLKFEICNIDIILLCVYRPPNVSKVEFIKELNNVTLFLTTVMLF